MSGFINNEKLLLVSIFFYKWNVYNLVEEKLITSEVDDIQHEWVVGSGVRWRMTHTRAPHA